MADETKLPTIRELYEDTSLALPDRIGIFSVLLNQPPQPKWVQINPYANNTKYIPIERLEWLMTYIFGQWHVEIKSTQLLANSVVTTVRVHYFFRPDPNSPGQWRWTEGIGAMPIQIDSPDSIAKSEGLTKGSPNYETRLAELKRDKSAIDFEHMKTNAIQLAAPASESYAFKDAVEKLGNLFGKDLNRKDVINYIGLMPQQESDSRPKSERLAEKLTTQQLEQ